MGVSFAIGESTEMGRGLGVKRVGVFQKARAMNDGNYANDGVVNAIDDTPSVNEDFAVFERSVVFWNTPPLSGMLRNAVHS